MANNLYFRKELTSEMIDENSLVHHVITKYEIRNNDFTNIMNTLTLLMNTGTKGKGKLAISFYGYDDTPKDVYEINEIRKYTQLLFKKCPSIFYFLTNIDYTRTVIFLCLCESESIKRTSPINVQGVPSESTIRKIIDGILDYGEKVNENSSVISNLLDEIFCPLNNPQDFLKILYSLCYSQNLS